MAGLRGDGYDQKDCSFVYRYILFLDLLLKKLYVP